MSSFLYIQPLGAVNLQTVIPVTNRNCIVGHVFCKVSCLCSPQVDFDDGNCPTYYNQIKGIHNVIKAVYNQFPSKCFTSNDHWYRRSYKKGLTVYRPASCLFADVPHISKAPVLMLRPRAWNMVEHNMMVRHDVSAGLAVTLCSNTCFIFLLPGGGEGGSWTSLWLWTPHVSLWKNAVWIQEWSLFLPVKSNTHTLKLAKLYKLCILTLGQINVWTCFCFSLFSRWRPSWRPDCGTEYLSGHNTRSAHWCTSVQYGFGSDLLIWQSPTW